MRPVILTIVLLHMWDVILESATKESDSCGNKWFGPKCQYMCRCSNEDCENNPACLLTDECQGGWFGPACQFVDLAYGKSAIKEITDGDDNTCMDARTVRNVNITCSNAISWFRVHLKTAGDAASVDLSKLRFSLKVAAGVASCPDSRYAYVNNITVDFQCASNEFVEELMLTDLHMDHLCTVHISGGRNVALRQLAVQSSNYSESSEKTAYKRWYFPAELAVDGNTNQDLIRGGSCSQTSDLNNVTAAVKANWTLTLDRPALVNRYTIYTRRDVTRPMGATMGFRLESYSETGDMVFSYEDNRPTNQTVYRITHSPAAIYMVTLTSTSRENVLSICEFEMYGESLCPLGQYGLECEHQCQCLESEHCLVSTGMCTTKCAIGYYGQDCNIPCDDGTYGHSCQHNCSQFCYKHKEDTPCNPVTGDCLLGCVDDHQPPLCDKKCDAGTYGPNCDTECSRHCHKPRKKTEVCSRLDGSCLHGCDDGYQDITCNASCSVGKYGKSCSLRCSEGCSPSNDSTINPCHHITGNCIFGCTTGIDGLLCNIRKLALAKKNYPLKNARPWFIGITIIVCCGGLVVFSAFLLCVKKKHPVKFAEI